MTNSWFLIRNYESQKAEEWHIQNAEWKKKKKNQLGILYPVKLSSKMKHNSHTFLSSVNMVSFSSLSIFKIDDFKSLASQF